jgi:hypothetical protein
MTAALVSATVGAEKGRWRRNAGRSTRRCKPGVRSSVIGVFILYWLTS